MCMVSMVTQGFPQQYPDWQQTTPLSTLVELKEILKRLDAIDKKLEAKDCADEKKAKFFDDLDGRIAALEKQKKRTKKLVVQRRKA